MPEIIRNRIIRPSTRKDTSVNYRVHIHGITAGDTLILNVKHESKPTIKHLSLKEVMLLKRKALVLK